MDTIKSLRWRYATKKFNKEKNLSETQINTLKEAFNLTATSYGLQPVKLVVIHDKDTQKELVAHSWNQPQVLDASHLLVICIPEKYTIEEVTNYFSLIKKIRNTADEVLNPFKDFLTQEIDKKTQEELYASNKNQAYIALGNLLAVCAFEKIDACPMEGFIGEKYDEILGLKKRNLKSILVLPVGFRADDDYMKDLEKVRKPLSETIIEF
jgi:nitroreductase